jgi:hypothetical protein
MFASEIGGANRGGSAYGGLLKAIGLGRCAGGKRPSNKNAPRNGPRFADANRGFCFP